MAGRIVALLTAAVMVGCATEPLLYRVDGDAIVQPLVVEQVDPVEGRRLFVARKAGHCVLCHRVAGLDAPFQGNIGPELSAVGARLTPGQIRLRIVDASRLNPNTIMPAYYRTDGLHQVAEQYRGRPVLSALEIEHMVAWLSGLKTGAGDG